MPMAAGDVLGSVAERETERECRILLGGCCCVVGALLMDLEQHIMGSTHSTQGCQMEKFDSFLSLHCARVEGEGRNPRRGRDQILQRSVAEP